MTTYPPKYTENLALVVLGLCAVAALHYQMPRWTLGLDPTFVHPTWVDQSPLPFFFELAAVHPLCWFMALAFSLVRVCTNYGWRVSRTAD